jgi:homoserine O-acetyltransferase
VSDAATCREGLARGRHPPLQPGWVDAPHHHVALGDFVLESGEAIRDCTVSYVVHGPQRTPGVPAEDVPVVLALSAIASHHHRLDFLIGPGRAFDPSRVAVVAIDALGNGLSSSPSNSALQPGETFPAFTIRDMVASQAAVIDALGVGRLHAVAGASMGGMQALQWAVSFPDRVGRVAAMTPMARTTPWAAAINECSRRALTVGGLAAWDAWVPLMQLLSGRTPARVDADFASGADAIAWIEARTAWWAARRSTGCTSRGPMTLTTSARHPASAATPPPPLRRSARARWWPRRRWTSTTRPRPRAGRPSGSRVRASSNSTPTGATSRPGRPMRRARPG